MRLIYFIITSLTVILPTKLFAQVGSGFIKSYQGILKGIYQDLMKMSGELVPVAQAIGGFGALFYIGYRVWKHIAAAEPIDFFPLFRPFCISLIISIYPLAIGVVRGVLEPIEIATQAMVTKSNTATEVLLTERAIAISETKEYQELASELEKRDTRWDEYAYPSGSTGDPYMSKGGNPFSFSIFTNSISFFIKLMLSIILQIVYFAAVICIDTLRTFHLLILAIIGPIVLCISIFDGFQHVLNVWLARFVNVFLWLPIANLFGVLISKVQQGMLHVDLEAMKNSGLTSFGTTDIAYLIFLLIATVGYFSIPSIANYIIHASGANTILMKVNKLSSAGRTMIMTAAGGGAGYAASQYAGGSMSADKPGNDMFHYSMADAKNSEPYTNESYSKSKISGNS
ncbi:conjugative transposon protein TraJ [Pseudoflavitalea rhizosphaerae]|uniref:conjugative transposon protein TraJ n=1 Tax=Pseudoflavitalea rhizosphaerae TaxID=1884793 RepID=UPI000F8E329F|nr:conjugative transposon protein TraJ [Pseudoflavitalea rhizosphaerae]